ncbi:PRC-barrel domain containing protein [Coriobacterium glomerans]|nr:PRC-barrel domain containing protein [Coriobacterium glomerans]
MPPEGRRIRRDGTPRRPSRLGSIHFPVFTADGRRVIGFMVKQRDVAGMIKQADRFVALDALETYEGALCVASKRDSFDAAAAARLGVDLDRCLIWTGMDVRTVSGCDLGYCCDAEFDRASGTVSCFLIISGTASKMLVGSIRMSADHLVGYRNGAMLVDDVVRDLELSGGAAARAAEASVVIGTRAAEAKTVIGSKVKKGAKIVDDKGSAAVSKGSVALGRQLGRTRGMFKAFKHEYNRAAGNQKRKR